MSAEGTIRTETHDRIFKIIIDNPTKKNAFSPAMMEQLSDALTELHNNDSLWVGVICAEGKDFTAGLDMPKFFGPNAEKRNFKDGNVDVFGLQKRCKKPIVTAVQGIVFTIGIELMLAGDIVVAADDSRFCQMESKRGIAPFGGAHFRFLSRTGWGNAMYHLFLCDEFTASRAREIGLVQELVPAGQQVERAMALAAIIAQKCAAWHPGNQGGGLEIYRAWREGRHRLYSDGARTRAQQRRRARRHSILHRAARRGVSGAVRRT